MTSAPTAPLEKVDDITERISGRLTPVVRRLVEAEVEKVRVAAPRVQVAKPDAELMRACAKVAAASDALAQAKFSGLGEVRARRDLEAAAKRLEATMRKHGRLP